METYYFKDLLISGKGDEKQFKLVAANAPLIADFVSFDKLLDIHDLLLLMGMGYRVVVIPKFPAMVQWGLPMQYAKGYRGPQEPQPTLDPGPVPDYKFTFNVSAPPNRGLLRKLLDNPSVKEKLAEEGFKADPRLCPDCCTEDTPAPNAQDSVLTEFLKKDIQEWEKLTDEIAEMENPYRTAGEIASQRLIKNLHDKPEPFLPDGPERIVTQVGTPVPVQYAKPKPSLWKRIKDFFNFEDVNAVTR